MSQSQNLKMAIKPGRRGPARLIAVTYPQIAKWTGYTLNTVRSYACRGFYDPRDLESVLTWINRQRAKRGWPLIGLPEKAADPGVDTLENVTGCATPLPATGYNARKGAFDP